MSAFARQLLRTSKFRAALAFLCAVACPVVALPLLVHPNADELTGPAFVQPFAFGGVRRTPVTTGGVMSMLMPPWVNDASLPARSTAVPVRD